MVKEDIKESKEIKKDNSEAKIVEVATEYGKAIQLPDGSLANESQALVYLINIVEKINKRL